MNRLSLLLFAFLMTLFLYGCSNNNGEEVKDVIQDETDAVSDEQEKAINAEASATSNPMTLPDGFPSDFPLPDNITITEIEDDSNDERYSFQIRFNFDPNIDMDKTFQMYNDYANSLGYNIIIGGEEYFADGVFQFGATSKMSSFDMFIVTLQPEGNTFGDIQLKVLK